VFPSKRNFYITGGKPFEMESCVIRDQGTDSLILYYNTNEGTDSIYSVTFTKNDAELKSIVDDASVVYTVEYHYGVEGVEQGSWLQNSTAAIYNMLDPMKHVAGITTKLRVNNFKHADGYAFLGYNLYRQSDEKWLYADDNWYIETEAPAGTEKKCWQVLLR